MAGLLVLPIFMEMLEIFVKLCYNIFAIIYRMTW